MNAEFCQRMVDHYEAILLENAGAESVTIDGETVRYADLEKKHAYWEGQLNRVQGRKRTMRHANLGSAWNG